MKFRSSIKEVREEKGLTQAELAEKCGVRRETIVFLEKGEYMPSVLLAYNVAQVLEKSIEELFDFKDSRDE